MSYLEYARITWANFILKLEGFEKLQTREDKRIRALAWQVFNSYPKKDGADLPETIFEYWPLPGDPKGRKAKSSNSLSAMMKVYEKAGLIKDGKLIYN